MRTKVLVPGNFSDHTMSVSNIDEYVKDGFRIGVYVTLIRRITVKIGNERKDVPAGSRAVIKGFADDGIVCTFEIAQGSSGRAKAVDWKCVPSNLQVAVGAVGGEAADPAQEKPGVDSKFAFLGEGVHEIYQDWETHLLSNEDASDIARAKTLVGFTLDNLVKALPTFTSKDFAIVKRDAELEVWTLRDFKAGTIIFAPEAFEVKPRFWTAGRAAIAKNSYVASGDKRPLVIDGRVRAAPDGKHGFALYWIVQRCAAGLKEINMEQSYTQADLVLNLTINGEETPIAKNASAMPSIPIIVNPKIVKKHTRLLAKVDQDLHKLTEKYEADAARAAAKKNKEENESKDNKKSLKRESETTDKDAKKAKK